MKIVSWLIKDVNSIEFKFTQIVQPQNYTACLNSNCMKFTLLFLLFTHSFYVIIMIT